MSKVRGHMCEGLKEFQEYSTYSCIPSFTEEGFVAGCDDTNFVPLIYCPFCREKLGDVEVYEYVCSDCDRIFESNKPYEHTCDVCGGYLDRLETYYYQFGEKDKGSHYFAVIAERSYERAKKIYETEVDETTDDLPSKYLTKQALKELLDSVGVDNIDNIKPGLVLIDDDLL